MIARHLRIHGRVQGVFYRAWATATAQELGVSGWLRNRHDGTVEAIVQGDESAVQRFIERAREGSPAAHVERIVIGEREPDTALDTFRQRPTA